MDNQHKHIKGYRDLTAQEVQLMNAIKAKGAELDALLQQVHEHITQQYDMATAAIPYDSKEVSRLNDTGALTWWARSKEDLQTGLMKLVRSVAQPTGF